MVGRQVELADAAGDRRALLDRHQPLVVAQVRAGATLLRVNLRGDGIDLGEQRLERRAIDSRTRAERRQHLLLALELLQQVGLEVGARGDVGDLEQRHQRGVMVDGRLVRCEVARPA